MRLFPRSLAVAAGLVAALGATALAGPAPDTGDEAGYSTDASGTPAAKPTAPHPPGTESARQGQAAPPAITIDTYDRAPAPREPAYAAPREAPPPAAAPVRPENPVGIAPPLPGQARGLDRSSPVAAMLESSLRGDLARTRDIRYAMPKKAFPPPPDRSGAAALSRIGNDLINRQDNPAEALKAYAAAYARDPSSSEITGSYGYALFRNGRFEEARDKEIACLEISPGYTPAWFVLGQVFGYLNQEAYAYASFVTACLFTKNIQTTLGFLDREKDKDGSPAAQAAAARAMAVCRRLP